MGDNFVTPEHQIFLVGEVRCLGHYWAPLLDWNCCLQSPHQVNP